MKISGIINLKTLIDPRSALKEINLSENIQISRDFSKIIDTTWLKWIGEIAGKRINNSNLFLIYSLDSDNSEPNETERSMVREEIFLFYTSLIINDILAIEFSYKPYLFSAEMNGQQTIIKSMSELNYPISLVSPINAISEKSMIQTYKIYNEFKKLNADSENYSRIIRGIKAFICGIEAKLFIDRIHFFVRSLEAFIAPRKSETRKQFAKRVSLLTKIKDYEFLYFFYDIRSNVEHMHHPFKDLKSLSNKEFQKITFKLEIITREIIKTFILNSSLWNLFTNLDIYKTWDDYQNSILPIWNLLIDFKEYENVIFYD